MTTAKKPDVSEIEGLLPIRQTMLLKIALSEKFDFSGNPFWEEVTCVGYNPQTVTLEAVVAIKQASGYSGGLCSAGSKEFVRFFVDYGAGFEDLGYTGFDVHDIPDAGSALHPIEYMVRMPLPDTGHRRCCDTAIIPTVRAVLSWNTPPSSDPNELNAFGDRKDAYIQLPPAPFSLICLIESGVLQKDAGILNELDLQQPLAKAKKTSATSFAELAQKYRKAQIPDHRMLAPALHAIIGKEPAAGAAISLSDVEDLKKLNIDLNAVVKSLASTLSDPSFEEITCVGLETAADTLGAVVRIKQPLGYSGDLCHDGSKEYVAFWADWDNDGVFDEYLGTVTVEVHDLDGAMPGDGVRYSVSLISSSIVQHLRDCTSSNIVGIRAVLSWATPPSTTDPNELNFWGDRSDVHVQLRSGTPVTGTELTDLIYRVGGVALPDIGPTTHLAFPSTVLTGACDAGAMDRPWGGNVTIQGRLYNTGLPSSVRFRVRYKPHAAADIDANWIPVTFSASFVLMYPLLTPPEVPVSLIAGIEPGCGSGWFNYLENPLALPPIFERDNHLANWDTGSLEGEYDLRLEYRRTSDVPGFYHTSYVVTIVLHNYQMVASTTATRAIDFSKDLDLVIDDGDCNKYTRGDSVHGLLRVQDPYFYRWGFDLQPVIHSRSAAPVPGCKTYTSLSDSGPVSSIPWTLDTGPMEECGYALILRGYDRTIINSNSAFGHSASKAVGFSVV